MAPQDRDANPIYPCGVSMKFRHYLRKLVFLAICLVMMLVVVSLAPAQETNRADGGTSAPGESRGDWRHEFNKTVFKAHHWIWILKYVERKGETLAIGLAYKNKGNAKRPMFMDREFMTTTYITDVHTNVRYPLQAVEGISTIITNVEQSTSKTARFTFSYPGQATQVRFTSTWITMFMRGAATVIDLKFPLDLRAHRPDSR